MRTFVLAGVLAIVAASLAAAEARGESRTATVAGVVTAADGARLPGVGLRLVDGQSGATVQSVSTEAGLFRIGGLAGGRYSLDAALEGFEPRRIDDIEIAEGQVLSLAVQLQVGTMREIVRVVGSAPRDSIETVAIRESAARDVGQAIAAVPGVFSLRRGAIANDVVVRGFKGSDLSVLIDGARIQGACPGRMDPPAFHVDFAEVSRVEVSKGPFDVKNQGGLGGVVNVVTQRAARGWHGTGTLSAASAATFSASAVSSIGTDRWSALGGASVRRADAYRDGAGISLLERANYRSQALASGAYDAWTGWGRGAIVPSAGTTVHASYTRQSAGTIVYPYLQMDAGFDAADRAGVRLESADLPGGWGAFATHAYYSRVDHSMTDELRTTARGFARGYSMATQAGTRTTGAKAEIHRGPVAMGAEVSRRQWSAQTMLAMRQYAPQASVPDATLDLAGGFVALTAALGSRWQLETGARVDRAVSDVDRSVANTSLYFAYHGTRKTRAADVLPAGHLRAAWRLADTWTATFAAAHGARVPDQQERYYALQRAGADWVGNPLLAPSRGTGFDVELRRASPGIDIAVTAFAYRVDDYVLVVGRRREYGVAGVPNATARSYANVNAVLRGLEVTATSPLGRRVFLSADGSLARGTTGGDDLPEMPPARGRVRVRFENGRWMALAEVVGSARQGRVASALGETPTPPFAVVNLRGALRLRLLDVTVGLENVLDALYAEHLSYLRDPFRNGSHVYEPGRTMTVNVSARF